MSDAIEVEAARAWIAANQNRFNTCRSDYGDGEIAFDFCVTLLRLLDAAREELASVRQIAEPWLMWANELDDDRPDDDVVSSLIEAGHYRRFAAALKAPPTRAQGESS